MSTVILKYFACGRRGREGRILAESFDRPDAYQSSVEKIGAMRIERILRLL